MTNRTIHTDFMKNSREDKYQRIRVMGQHGKKTTTMKRDNIYTIKYKIGPAR
jgi:hypothetical protein